MIIIIEGPDGSGKTTLAEKLAQQTGYRYEHRSKPETEEERDNMYADYAKMCRKQQNLILDRCWYSELVYGTVMRDQKVMSVYDMYELEQLLAKQGAMIIYCTDTPAKLFRRAHSRGEDYITKREDFEAICEEYDRLMSIPHIIPVVRYSVPVS